MRAGTARRGRQEGVVDGVVQPDAVEPRLAVRDVEPVLVGTARPASGAEVDDEDRRVRIGPGGGRLDVAHRQRAVERQRRHDALAGDLAAVGEGDAASRGVDRDGAPPVPHRAAVGHRAQHPVEPFLGIDERVVVAHRLRLPAGAGEDPLAVDRGLVRVLRRDLRRAAGGVERVERVEEQLAQRRAEVPPQPVLQRVARGRRVVEDLVQDAPAQVLRQVRQVVLDRVGHVQLAVREPDRGAAVVPAQRAELPEVVQQLGIAAEDPVAAAQLEAVGLLVDAARMARAVRPDVVRGDDAAGALLGLEDGRVRVQARAQAGDSRTEDDRFRRHVRRDDSRPCFAGPLPSGTRRG